MKSLCFAAFFAVLLAGCASTSTPHAGMPASQTMAANAFGPDLVDGVKSQSSASQGPRIAVGTRYSDERLNLPWFLNDAIDAANGH
ncbi:hypothetical protein [Bordetella sp. FB-8]|uniref:hypothetical protein n=1 Tax=Bordetella sp. FB-8 TaxID=1159870 RepID=UPI0003A1A4FF|nr:hypothetical protein [Bordetella sp. FB-8]